MPSDLVPVYVRIRLNTYIALMDERQKVRIPVGGLDSQRSKPANAATMIMKALDSYKTPDPDAPLLLVPQLDRRTITPRFLPEDYAQLSAAFEAESTASTSSISMAEFIERLLVGYLFKPQAVDPMGGLR